MQDTKNRRSVYILVAFISTLLGLITVIFGVYFYFNSKTITKTSEEISSTGEHRALNLTYIEIADDNLERARGLMHRQTLCKECGMLFVFEREELRSFWMKNTIVSLDIIFMDKDGRIVSISENAEPLNEEKNYNSEAPSKYVLEVNAGIVAEVNLQKGQQIDVKSMLEKGIDYRFVE